MAEDITLIISILVTLAVGIGGGVLFSSVFGNANKRAKELEEEVSNLKKEQEQYKEQVSQHFQKTANLFQDMTEQYKTIYTHLAEGAETLCSENSAPPALDLPEKPRIADKPEDIAEAEVTAEESASPEEPQEAATEAPVETKPEQAEEDHMMGDAPNIPDISDMEESDKTKIH